MAQASPSAASTEDDEWNDIMETYLEMLLKRLRTPMNVSSVEAGMAAVMDVYAHEGLPAMTPLFRLTLVTALSTVQTLLDLAPTNIPADLLADFRITVKLMQADLGVSEDPATEGTLQ